MKKPEPPIKKSVPMIIPTIGTVPNPLSSLNAVGAYVDSTGPISESSVGAVVGVVGDLVESLQILLKQCPPLKQSVSRRQSCDSAHPWQNKPPQSTSVSTGSFTPLIQCASVGAAVVGESVGVSVGLSVGVCVGLSVGLSVGGSVGLLVGNNVGDLELGELVGLSVGELVGTVGVAVGANVPLKQIHVRVVEHGPTWRWFPLLLECGWLTLGS